MLFDILEKAGLKPSIISGAGLVSIIREGKIGNAKVGAGAWLVIEADESDGSIVHYHPEIGLLLNVDKDHQEIDELMGIFTIFKNNSKIFIVNQSNALAKQLSQNMAQDFSSDENSQAGFIAGFFGDNKIQISRASVIMGFIFFFLGWFYAFMTRSYTLSDATGITTEVREFARKAFKYVGVTIEYEGMGLNINGIV